MFPLNVTAIYGFVQRKFQGRKMKIKTVINDRFYSSYRHVNMPLLGLKLLSIFNIWNLFTRVKDLDTKINKKKPPYITKESKDNFSH